MKYYLIRWDNGSFAIVGAEDLQTLFDILDEWGNPNSAKITKLPTTSFGWDSEYGFNERRKEPSEQTGSEIFESIDYGKLIGAKRIAGA